MQGAGGVAGLVVGVVDSDNVDRHIILRRSRDDHLLGASLDVQLSLLPLGEHAGGLANVLGTAGTPRDGGRVLLVEDLNLDAVDDEELFAVVL